MFLKIAKILNLLDCVFSLIWFAFTLVTNLLSYNNNFHVPDTIIKLNITGLIITVFLLIPIHLILEKEEKKGSNIMKVSRAIEIVSLWKWFLFYLFFTILFLNYRNDYLIFSAALLLFYSICFQASFHLYKVFAIYNKN